MSDDQVMRRVECPIWHSPLFFVVPDGLEVRCKSCRGVLHHFSREKLEKKWSEINQSQGQSIPIAACDLQIL
jgi:hypothetical protein